MSGFEDDFGEVVEPVTVKEDVADLLETKVENTEEATLDLLCPQEEEVVETIFENETVNGK